jgi:hypothetical protein
MRALLEKARLVNHQRAASITQAGYRLVAYQIT